jgi:hypothetical protein
MGKLGTDRARFPCAWLVLAPHASAQHATQAYLLISERVVGGESPLDQPPVFRPLLAVVNSGKAARQTLPSLGKP